MTSTKTFDDINNLPTDNSQLSFKEKKMFDALYPSENVEFFQNVAQAVPVHSGKVWYAFKDIIVASILFMVLSLPFVDSFITKIFKSENFYYKLAIKSIIFALLFFIIMNFALSRSRQQ